MRLTGPAKPPDDVSNLRAYSRGVVVGPDRIPSQEPTRCKRFINPAAGAMPRSDQLHSIHTPPPRTATTAPTNPETTSHRGGPLDASASITTGGCCDSSS